MKTLHNTKNCNYRRFLHKRLKEGRISGKLYKFICRNYPYRVTTSIVQICVREVLDGRMTENKAIAKMQDNDLELKRQMEMYKSNIECRNKISEKKTAKKFTTEQEINNKENQEYLKFIQNKFGANKISRKVLDHAVIFIKKCMKENFYLPTRFKTSLYRIFTCEKFEISLYEKKFFLYFKCALSKTHKYSIYKQRIK